MATVEHYRQVGGWPANAPLSLPLTNAKMGGHVTIMFETVGEVASEVGENYRAVMSYGAVDPINNSTYKEAGYIYTGSLPEQLEVWEYETAGPIVEFDYYPIMPNMWLTTEFDIIGSGPSNLIVNVWIVNPPS